MGLRKRWLVLLATPAILAAAFAITRYSKHVWAAYPAYEESLRHALAQNDFAREFASDEDRARLRQAFAFLEGGTAEEKVLRLVDWINTNIATGERPTVRAVALLEAKSAACEVHALAVAALESWGIKARWISGAKSSLGFGYLEAHVEHGWRLYKLRDPEHTQLGLSAYELFRQSEPALSVRTFYRKRDQSVHSWRGSVYPALFPLANLERHPELMPLFTSDRGVPLTERRFDPHDYLYAWFHAADDQWVRAGDAVAQFERAYASAPWAKPKFALDLRFVRIYAHVPSGYVPTPLELRVVFP